jgi:PEP-CTERM motif
MRKEVLAVVGVLVLLSAVPAWANHVDRGTSSMGSFLGPTDTCIDDTVNGMGAPCLFFVATPSANLDGFDAFQVFTCESGDTTCANKVVGGNGEFVYEIPNFSGLTSVTLALESANPDFGTFLCNSGNTQCVNNSLADPTENPDGTFTFSFVPTPTTGNSANTSAWFFYSDPQGCNDTGGSEDCSSSTGANNIGNIAFTTPNTNSTPEPASLALLGTGLLVVAGLVRRKRSKS